MSRNNHHAQSDHPTAQATPDARIYKRLVESPLFQTYRDAFTKATGMSLQLIPYDENIPTPAAESTKEAGFCQLLHESGNSNSPCSGCATANCSLRRAVNDRPETVTCFAGMRETVVPVRAANRTIALLMTGQVFTEEKNETDFLPIARQLEKHRFSPADIEELEKRWSKVEVVPTDRYESVITLMAAFALQLSDLLNRLMIEDSNAEPDVVARAKSYIRQNLADKITLEQVAEHVGVSPYYFCKVFKQSTQMTLTEFINRRRIEWAKQLLMTPNSRITGIAYDIGYQSLSQFNRSFLKYVGVSPTKFREGTTPANDSKMNRSLQAAAVA